MTWRLIGGLFSLKTLVLACVLAPVPAMTASTPALAQFQLVVPIPGIGINFRGGRRYYGPGYSRSGRHSHRGRSRGESRSAAASSGSGQTTLPARSSASSGGKVRGTVD